MQSHPAKITAQDVLRTFEAAERKPLSEGRAQAVAGWINSYGIEHAATGANVYGETTVHTDILIYEAALMEAGSVRVRAQRMRREADALEQSAERHLQTEAEFTGKALFQRQRGQISLAEEFQSTADAGSRLAAEKQAQAAALNARASELEGRAEFADGLFGVAAARPATQAEAA